ncbi:hypothetical protein [Paenibacillus sp. FSL H7-0918]
MDFDFIHRTYLSYAHPANDPSLIFYVGQDIESKEIQDLYPYEVNKRNAGRK